MAGIFIKSLLLTSLLQAFFIISVFGIISLKKVDLGLGINVKCSPTKVACACGWSGEQIVEIEVKQCSYFHRFKTKCKPCDDDTEEKVCPKFLACAQCHPEGGDRCLACTKEKYGRWCEYDCDCENGGYCDIKGECTCPEGFEGLRCEKRKGCRRPNRITLPLKAQMNPSDFPHTIIYSCKDNYYLKGVAVVTCLPDGRWSSNSPKCLAKCPVLSAPANGRLTFDGNELVEDTVAEVTCDTGYRLKGEDYLHCLQNGTWSDEVPQCDELAFCPDPGRVAYAKRIIPGGTAKRVNNTFHQETTISYECRQGFQQMGENTMLCQDDGQWSSEKPVCLKVSTIVPSCETKGSEVVSEVGVPVRVYCPPECVNEDSKLWGTSIYRSKSLLCRAAIHAGKITNSGGLVAIINNGEYTSFTGSFANNIESHSFEGTDESFRFDKLPPMVHTREMRDCPEGLIRLQNICALISTYPTTEKDAEATCINLGLAMVWPDSSDDQRKLLLLLESKKANQIWTGKLSEEIEDSSQNRNETHEDMNNNSSEVQIQYFMTPKPKCETMMISGLGFVEKDENCDQQLHFLCTHSPYARALASCEDPGLIANGEAKHVGKINNAFYVGSSIEYTCEALHYLEGADKISCRGNGTWSDEKPSCIRVDTCEGPPIPFGGFVTYLPPLDTPMAQRLAISRSGNPMFRGGRLPVGLSARPSSHNMIPLSSSTTPGPDTLIDLPPGHYRIGTRALYDCESRYYQLVGSKSRRCQEQGQWSGRSPTCIPVCGKSDSPRTPFIVNGNATDIGQWPWQVGLARYVPDNDRWFVLCGGALLNERWVITAAHCLAYSGSTIAIDADRFRVYVGKYHRDDSRDDEYVQVKNIREIHIHPDYDPGIFDADIALIQLESPVQLNSRVQPICLPTEQTTQQNLDSGSRGVVTGWGLNENETYSNTLQQAVLPVISNEECENGYAEAGMPLTVTDNMFCAGFKEGRYDACSGDSGGPMVFADDSSKERRWVLEGIVSWGSPLGCGNKDQYGGYTTVSKFLDWIHLFV